jgi:hypothetical protein
MGTTTRAVRWIFAALVVMWGAGYALSAEQDQPAPKAAPAAATPSGAERGSSAPGTPATADTPAAPGAPAGATNRPSGDASANPYQATTNLPASLGGPNSQIIPRLYNQPAVSGLPGVASPRDIPPFRQSQMPPSPFTPQPRGGGPGAMFRPAATYGLGPGPASSATAQRPGANYRPTSPISPYMGLFAPRTPGIDNYNAYVRPQLQQNAINQQTESRFRNLQSMSDLQGTTLQQLEQGSQLFESEGAPAGSTFMDFGAYYPSRTLPPTRGMTPNAAPRVTR